MALIEITLTGGERVRVDGDTRAVESAIPAPARDKSGLISHGAGSSRAGCSPRRPRAGWTAARSQEILPVCPASGPAADESPRRPLARTRRGTPPAGTA